MAQLAMSMDTDGQGTMKNEYAHVDATHDRVRGYKSVTLWVYHEISRKLLCLAVMDVEQENSENLTMFWSLVNEMLQEVSGNSMYKFKPKGFVADEHHANWQSIQNVYGSSGTSKTVSCEFHFKQSVHRHSRRLASDSAEFVRMCNVLLEAPSVDEFEKSVAQIEKPIANHPTLFNWFHWWMARKTHIFRAFKPIHAPSTNMAEIGHARLHSVGR